MPSLDGPSHGLEAFSGDQASISQGAPDVPTCTHRWRLHL